MCLGAHTPRPLKTQNLCQKSRASGRAAAGADPASGSSRGSGGGGVGFSSARSGKAGGIVRLVAAVTPRTAARARPAAHDTRRATGGARPATRRFSHRRAACGPAASNASKTANKRMILALFYEPGNGSLAKKSQRQKLDVTPTQSAVKFALERT